jgi:hypothetical protein
MTPAPLLLRLLRRWLLLLLVWLLPIPAIAICIAIIIIAPVPKLPPPVEDAALCTKAGSRHAAQLSQH